LDHFSSSYFFLNWDPRISGIASYVEVQKIIDPWLMSLMYSCHWANFVHYVTVFAWRTDLTAKTHTRTIRVPFC
jgi:hypothetical protein